MIHTLYISQDVSHACVRADVSLGIISRLVGLAFYTGNEAAVRSFTS